MQPYFQNLATVSLIQRGEKIPPPPLWNSLQMTKVCSHFNDTHPLNPPPNIMKP